MSDTPVPTQANALRRALAALEQMQARLDAAERARHEPIAIVGMGCRFPGSASDPDAFWELLRAGVDAVGEVPPDRWDADAYYDPDPDAPGKMASRWGGFVDGIDRFDPQLFGITPREAAAMDPQQRLVLEVGWEALENAGIAPHSLAESATGVFVGIVNNDYEHLSRSRGGQEQFGAYFASGSAQSIAAGRLSYLLGLRGPSIAVDTACSSSLVAVHLAVQSLRARECSLALAGGVNAILIPEASIAISRYRMLSADGRCKTFDAAADGFARGEGCGLVVLKRLADALADGDRVVAVIRGSAVNQDGASSGLTAPNGPAQEAVIRAALADAGISPADIGYVEAHGTGTSLGDPIEVQALAATLGPGRSAERPLLIGSVKTNVGHLEAAAGIAGLIKLVLCLCHNEIPPHLHLRTPNPLIPWPRLPVAVPRGPVPWPADAPRIGAVSSFGFSGTNAHLILAAAPDAERPRPAAERPSHLLALSARSESALRELTRRCAEHLAAHPDLALGDVAHTANVGRSHLSPRLTLRADTSQDALAQLQAVLAGQQPASVRTGNLPPGDPPRVAFLFTGQGSQYVGMGRGLYDTDPTFRAALERCAEILDPQLERPLLALLYPAPGDEAEATRLLDRTACTQPALFALEYALCALWRSWGVEPAAVLGHSVGEYVAACVAGVFTLEDGLALIAERARLMQALPAGGAMAAVLAARTVVEKAIGAWPERLAIAAINGPESVVISGDAAALEATLERLQARGISAKRLRVSHAFHSPLMDPILERFERAAAKVSFSPPRLRLISNVSGKPASASEIACGAYWRRHIRAPVRFATGMRALRDEGVSVFLEVGPGSTLLGMGRQCLPADACAWIPSLRQDRDDWAQMLDALAGLYVRGVPVDWAAFDRPYDYRPVALPTYPFERQRYWIEDKGRRLPATLREASAHPLLGQRLLSPLPQAQFENELAADSFGFIADHRVQGRPILPAAAFLELALAAAGDHFGQAAAGGLTVEDVVIGQTLDFAEGAVRTVQTVVDPEGAKGPSFRVFSQGDEEADWRLHARGRLANGALGEPKATDSVAAIRERCAELRSADEHHARMRAHGLDFGPAMHGVVEIHRRDGEALGRIRAPHDLQSEVAGFRLHPAVLDACLQVVGAALPDRALPEPYLPLSIHACRWIDRPPFELWSHVVLDLPQGALPDTLRADVRLLDDTGKLLAEVAGLSLRRHAARRTGGDRFEEWLYEVAWRPAPREMAAPAQVLAPAALADAISAALPAAAERHGLAAEHELYPQLEALSAAYVADALQRLGWQPEPGRTFTSEEVSQACGILPRYRRLLGRLLGILAEDGMLTRQEGGEWRVLRAAGSADLQADWHQLLARYPSSQAQLRLTGSCGSELAGALTGAVDPLSLLFPGGSLDLAEQLYRESPKALVFNGLVQEAVRAAVAGSDSRRVRVLEIGAGTGATTASVLPVLPADRTEYVFTDLSPAFLGRARERFADHPFVDYRLLDIEHDPADQGFAGQRFDIVLAVNVLHATADLTTTLRHVRSLLAPGGLLVLVEGTGPERWIDITFGLTDGWWRFTDTATREGYPLLSPERWSELLSAAGFEATATAPADALRHRQAILLARAPADREQQAGTWLVCSDSEGVGERLAELLRSRAHHVVSTSEAAAQNLENLLHDAAGDAERPLRGIVHLAALDACDPADATSLEPVLRPACGSVLQLVQALGRMAIEPPRLWLVTRGAQAVAGGEPVTPAQAPIWGLATVLRQEHPELGCTTIDLDAATKPSAQVSALLNEVLHPDREDRVALRGGIRHLARLVRSQLAVTEPAPAKPVRLEVPPGGVLDEIGWTRAEHRAPGRGEVEIRVHATGLNFRDVMNALAMREDPEPLGGECSGTITAVGDGVDGLALGDEVIAVALGGFSTFVTVDSGLVLPKPPQLALADAAGLPLAFLTAYYCLHEAADLSAGERILVQAAAGGVGLAAVRLARHARAEVFATAGSDEKRAFLRSLGVAHVFDSRSLGFAEAVLEATGGRGVDVVLNSLVGEFIPHSFAALAEGGRFVEIGKREILSAEDVARIKPGARYHAVDLASELHARSDEVRPLFREVMQLVTSGAVEPLPVRRFPTERVADAFRFMAQAKHIGKIVITQKIEEGAPGPVVAAPRRDGSYLITGGLGGLGLLTARWLADRGAGTLVLMGRNPPSEAATAAIREIEALGACVRVALGDAALAADLRRVLDEIGGDLPPLRGIVHAAGVLEDGALVRQDWQQFARVLAPKADGAWLLHALTRERELDLFVLFSSIASILGSSGQANHAAANAFMDALAHHRHTVGLPALSIGWGVWSEIGSAAARGTVERVAEQGAGAIAPQEGLCALEMLLGMDKAYVAVQPIDWTRYLARVGEAPPWLAEVARDARTPASSAPIRDHAMDAPEPRGETILQQLAAAPASDRREVLLAHVHDQVLQVIGLGNGQRIDPLQPLSHLGVDSLMAVELRNRLGRSLAVPRPLPATLVFDYPTIGDISGYLAREVLGLEDAPGEPRSSDLLEDIEGLSDDEVDELFADMARPHTGAASWS